MSNHVECSACGNAFEFPDIPIEDAMEFSHWVRRENEPPMLPDYWCPPCQACIGEAEMQRMLKTPFVVFAGDTLTWEQTGQEQLRRV